MKNWSIVLIIFTFLSCKSEKYFIEAERKSQFIITNIEAPNIIQEFPEKYFSKVAVKSLLKKFFDFCNLNNAKFIKSSSVNTSSPNELIVKLKYSYDCATVEFTFSYYIEEDKPILHSFYIQTK